MNEINTDDRPTLESWYGRAIPQGDARHSTDFTELPIIDLAPMFGGDSVLQQTTVAALRQACIEVGFFYIKNHGIPQQVVADTFAIARQFFALPQAEKAIILKAKTPGFGGFSPLMELDYGDPSRGSLAEAFNMNLELPLDDPWVIEGRTFYYPNSWPQRPAEFRTQVMDYYSRGRALGDILFKAFARALDIEPDFFIAKSRKPIAMMRINHYPPQSTADDPRRIGAGAHTDYECFTILAQEDRVSALEVVNGRGEWVAVPPIPGTFVINIADQMARWTNDLFRSTMHRVINRNEIDRCSMALFQGVNSDTVISVLPNCVPEGERSKYDPITAEAYVASRVADVYGYPLTETRSP